jgi:glycosyltransferase involved in cell wall biosynthesis
VTGQDPPTELLQYASPSIVFEGHVGDIAKFYDDARVAIVPMRFGAGVKLKAIEALQYGVPTVSTTIGAEGIDLHQTGALAITDDAAEFAFNVATLLDNPQLWEDRRERIRAMHDIWAQQPAGTSWSSVIETALADRVSTLSSDSTYGDEGLRR